MQLMELFESNGGAAVYLKPAAVSAFDVSVTAAADGCRGSQPVSCGGRNRLRLGVAASDMADSVADAGGAHA